MNPHEMRMSLVEWTDRRIREGDGRMIDCFTKIEECAGKRMPNTNIILEVKELITGLNKIYLIETHTEHEVK